MLTPVRLNLPSRRKEGAAAPAPPPVGAPAGPGKRTLGVAPEGLGEKAAAKPRPAAVLVVHGMGQQVRFETLDQVYAALKRAQSRPRRGASGGTMEPREVERVGARRVKYEASDGKEKALERVEVRMGKKGAAEKREVHLYEAYWAPLTEGRVKLRDVVGFILRGAGNGLGKSVGGMCRWMFGKPRVMPGSIGLTAVLCGVLYGLFAFTTVLLAAATYFAKDRGWLKATPAALDDLTAVVGLLALTLGAFIVLLMAAGPAKGAWRSLAKWAAWIALAPALVLLALFPPFLALVLLQRAPDLPLWDLPAWMPFAVWGLFVLVGAAVRWWVIQFIGDVAAYVSPHKLDRFHDLRDQIKAKVGEVAQAVYGARGEDGEPLYDEVFVVGHSLGSVAAYDALNGLVSDEQLAPPPGRTIAERTKLLLTFGSPLDKTAFFFTAQARRTEDTREELAALVQPLIQSYAHRPQAWINVHARLDVLGGPLDAYDPPADDPLYDRAKAVRNERDEDSDLPLMAHTQLWTTSRVWLHLGEAIVP